MSCRCFTEKPSFPKNISFLRKLELSKCHCESRFVVSENSERFYILSRDSDAVEKYKIDGYFDTDMSEGHIKCDYYFLCHTIERPNISVFVELKGGNVSKALNQIEATFERFIANGYYADKNDAVVRCAIVNSRYPSNDSTFRANKQRLQRKFQHYNMKVENHNRNLGYNPQTDKFIKD